jgi:signal transduction histidine kinase
VGQAAQMMLEHREELGQFITTDERGKQLPAYLAEVGKFLVEEQNTLLGEMKSLTDAVEHIKQIVNMQQAHTTSQAIMEMTEPADLLEEAIRLHYDSFDRHHIKVVREFAFEGPVCLEKHKTMQILTNLISNAKDALKECDQVDRQIRFRLATTRGEEGDRLRISVSDNGAGITPENLSRIFTFGFSTRSDGHGFGLHSAANMAKQMGGSLLGASDGPGKGAEFTLELPIVHQQVTA